MYPPETVRILIVEDDPGTALLQRRAVERAGYQVVMAQSAEEGLALLRSGPVDLILLDNRLPGEMSGLDFLTTAKSLAPGSPVIMVSGSEAEGAVLQALRSGARDFIRKDVNYLEYLPRAIEAVLQTARLESQLRGERLPAQRPLLLIEAAAAAAALEKRQFERAGFDVFTARDAAEALRVLGESDIGLLVVDRESGGADGLETYRQIQEAGHNVPAILMTAGSDEQTIIAALRSGFEDVVLKRGEYLSALQEAVLRVSERIRVETQVAGSKATLAGIVNSAMDAILLLDEQFRITLFNPAAERIFEAPSAQAIGAPITRFIPELERHLRESGPVEDRPTRFDAHGIRPGGRRAELELTLSRMEAGGRRFISVIARDVTQRKELERLLLQKDKLESLGLLAGGIAHDFNNLLVGIMGNTSLALETISTNNPARTMLKDVMLASETAGNLMRQLLAYAGKGRFLIEAVDLSDLVRQIANLLQTSIPKNVQLRLELMDGLPSVEADVTQIQQLIMNLVINGAEAIGDAQGTVLITTGVQHVDEEYVASVLVPTQISPGNYVNLQVHDTGTGMTQETVDKIFDPFFTTKFTGRGLGLAAALGIVRGHKGAIKVYSTAGQGTTFKVLFPASEHQATKPTPHVVTERSVEGETVLVVDDEQIVRRSAKAMLERYGYSVVMAENGREAVELFRVLADKIAMVLLDMTMPVMGGEETFRELKQIRGDVRVVLSSGYNEAEAVRRFTGKGLAGFLQKPYSAVTLAEKVLSVLRDSRGTAQS
jgi:PAS domain S-box-containing protein